MMRTESDEIIGWQEDVTARHERETAVRDAEERFRTLLEHCPDALLVERDGRVLLANRRLVELLGLARREEIAGTPVLQWVHPDDRAAVVGIISAEGEVLAPREVRLRGRDGEGLPVEITGVRLALDGLPAVFLVARSLADRRRLEVERLQTEKLSSLGMLAAGVAHEINNPLTAVNANLEMLGYHLPRLAEHAARLGEGLTQELGAERALALTTLAGPLLDREHLKELTALVTDARDAAGRVQTIVVDLKQFARPEENEGPVDLAAVVERALRLAHHELRHRARVVREIAPVPPVRGDEGRLCQVLLNILVNAGQAFANPRVDENVVRVRIRAEDDNVILDIEDNGCGIPRDVLPRIFDPFFTTKPPGLGSGIGLSISRHLVERLGGRIEVASEVGRGTRMTIILRAERAETVPTPTARQRGAAAVVAPAVRRGRVLIIDDEAAICRALERYLSNEWEVVSAPGGRAALDVLARDRDFSVILCDLMMPDCSGIDIHAWMKEHEPRLVERMIFATGGVTDAAFKAFVARIDNPVLDKPLNLAALASLLQRHGSQTGRAGERRSAPRLPGFGLAGKCNARASGPLAVVDFSLGGIRLRGSSELPCTIGDVIALSIENMKEPGRTVRASAQLVRTLAQGSFADLCFAILSMDTPSWQAYRSWIDRAQGEAPLSGHRTAS